MAGIGFTLNKLANQDNLSGTFRAYLHAAFIAAGPWMLTIIAIGSTVLLSEMVTTRKELENFRLILIYNFGFSMILSSPVCMIATRFLADEIHHQNLAKVPSLLLGTFTFNLLVCTPFVYLLYFVLTNLPIAMAIGAAMNFLAIASIWLVAVFLSTLKEFTQITKAFALGLLIATVVGSACASVSGGLGLVMGFTIGMLFILFRLLHQVLIAYSYPLKNLFTFFPYFRRYWELALGGLFYNMGCWVDKWVMWSTPEASYSQYGLLSYPAYDSAMFLAYLTAIPALAAFVFKVETEFFRTYTQYYKGILAHDPLSRIENNLKKMIDVILVSGRNQLLLNGSLVLLTILLAPTLFSWIGINYLQLSMFRFGVLGAFFHIGALFSQIILSYFDNRPLVLSLQFFFFISNLLLSLATKQLGFPAYGLGYLLSSILTFSLSMVALMKYLKELNYHTFLTTNSSVTR